MADRKKGKEDKERSLSQRWKDLLPNISASDSSRVKPEKLPSQSDPVSHLQWTSKEQQILRKIQVLERPSVSSINPTSLRILTPSPLEGNPEEEEEDQSCSSTDNKDVTELEEDTLGLRLRDTHTSGLTFYVESVFVNVGVGGPEGPGGGGGGGGVAPKIWISKSASMEHDLN